MLYPASFAQQVLTEQIIWAKHLEDLSFCRNLAAFLVSFDLLVVLLDNGLFVQVLVTFIQVFVKNDEPLVSLSIRNSSRQIRTHSARRRHITILLEPFRPNYILEYRHQRHIPVTEVAQQSLSLFIVTHIAMQQKVPQSLLSFVELLELNLF